MCMHKYICVIYYRTLHVQEETCIWNVFTSLLTSLNNFTHSTEISRLSTSCTALLIDDILLTKFGTIYDKVGVVLSMVYISVSPVMFVGCGRSYNDLKKLNAKSIVKTLLKRMLCVPFPYVLPIHIRLLLSNRP